MDDFDRLPQPLPEPDPDPARELLRLRKNYASLRHQLDHLRAGQEQLRRDVSYAVGLLRLIVDRDRGRDDQDHEQG